MANFDNKEITPRTYVIAENVGHYLNYEAERGIFVRPHPFARNEMKFKKKTIASLVLILKVVGRDEKEIVN